jgi:hypothetical protein
MAIIQTTLTTVPTLVLSPTLFSVPLARQPLSGLMLSQEHLTEGGKGCYSVAHDAPSLRSYLHPTHQVGSYRGPYYGGHLCRSSAAGGRPFASRPELPFILASDPWHTLLKPPILTASSLFKRKSTAKPCFGLRPCDIGLEFRDCVIGASFGSGRRALPGNSL